MASAVGHKRLAAALAVACVVLDLGLFSADAVHAAPVPRGNVWAGLPTRGGRVLSTCWMDLGESLESRVPTIDGLANMYLGDYADWAYVVKAGDVPPAGVLVTKLNAQDGSLPARRDLLDLANVTTVVSCAALDEPALQERGHHDHYFVYQNDTARARAFWTCGAEDFSRADVMTRLVRGEYLPDGDLTGLVPAIEPVTGAARGTDREWLIGTRPCGSRGTVDVVEQDRPDGRVIADVDAPIAGYAYFTEPHYSERRAWVDGSSVDVRKTNLAFTAVEVPAGRHRVELRIVPGSFYAGAGISGLTLVGWLTASWRAHRSGDAGRV
jgi:hypothetical protein